MSFRGKVHVKHYYKGNLGLPESGSELPTGRIEQKYSLAGMGREVAPRVDF